MKLQAENITKLCNGKKVLDQLQLTLEKGKIYGLTGRIGVGKTTLFSILSKQLLPDAGTVHLYDDNGRELDLTPGHVFFPEDLSLTIQEKGRGAQSLSGYFQELSHICPGWDSSLAETLAGRYQLSPDKKLGGLSKGMMSMTSIIAALASKADFTFLDEPEAGMDTLSREKFYQMLLDEFSDSGRAFVIATHLIDEVSDLTEEVIFLDFYLKSTLDCGRIRLMENTQQLLGRSFLISGLKEKTEALASKYESYDMGNFGRGKSIAVLLRPGESLPEDPEFTIKPLTLQKIFAALCMEE